MKDKKYSQGSSVKRWGIMFKGFDELMEKYDKLGGDLKEIATKCLEVAPQEVNPLLEAAMNKHIRTGRTKASIIKDAKIEWSGSIGTIPVGFDLSKGGMPSIFLMYGTPRMKKDTKLYNAIYGKTIKKKISAKQEEILMKAIDDRMGR